LHYFFGGHEVNKSTSNRIVVLGVLALLMAASGCKKKQAPLPPQPPPKPVTATLSANPTSIEAGQSATLTWSTENATDVRPGRQQG
jgi:peptidoglycan-associated lipoprotein